MLNEKQNGNSDGWDDNDEDFNLDEGIVQEEQVNKPADTLAGADAATSTKVATPLDKTKDAFNGMASSLKIKSLSPRTQSAQGDQPTSAAARKSKQIFADMKGKAASLKEKVMAPKAVGTDPIIDGGGLGNEKVDPLEKSKRFFNDMKGKASTIKILPITTATPSSDDPTGDDLAATDSSDKPDPLEKSKQFFSGMKDKASNLKIKALASTRSHEEEDEEASTTTATTSPASGAPTEDSTEDTDKPDPLEKSKQFFSDMRGRASNLKIKALASTRSSEDDELGLSERSHLRPALDKMKLDMRGFADSMKRISTKSNTTSSAEEAVPAFTIGDEDSDEERFLNNNSVRSELSMRHPEDASAIDSSARSDFSMKLSEMVHAAKTTASDSLSGMPSLASFITSESTVSSGSSSRRNLLSEKFASFRSSGMRSIGEIGHDESSRYSFEQVEFYANGPTPTIVDELTPQFTPRARNIEEHWVDESHASKDFKPTMVSRRASVGPTPTIVQLPPAPAPAAVEGKDVSNSS